MKTIPCRGAVRSESRAARALARTLAAAAGDMPSPATSPTVEKAGFSSSGRDLCRRTSSASPRSAWHGHGGPGRPWVPSWGGCSPLRRACPRRSVRARGRARHAPSRARARPGGAGRRPRRRSRARRTDRATRRCRPPRRTGRPPIRRRRCRRIRTAAVIAADLRAASVRRAGPCPRRSRRPGPRHRSRCEVPARPASVRVRKRCQRVAARIFSCSAPNASKS